VRSRPFAGNPPGKQTISDKILRIALSKKKSQENLKYRSRFRDDENHLPHMLPQKLQRPAARELGCFGIV
jgi:hypothetical protein